MLFVPRENRYLGFHVINVTGFYVTFKRFYPKFSSFIFIGLILLLITNFRVIKFEILSTFEIYFLLAF